MAIMRGGAASKVVVLLAVLAIIAGCTSKQQAPQAGPVTPEAAVSQTSGSAGSLDGAWEGRISVAGQDLPITLNLAGLGGTIDIPVQNAKGIALQGVSVQGDQVKFEMMPQPRTATFTGTVNGDQMSGVFEQSGYKGTWTASRLAATTTSAPKNYVDEEITFKNGEYTLAGTLTIPNGAGPHPAVILVSGSGAQNRDEEIFGFKPFAILAVELGNRGVAVLRYDDRGVGGSTNGTAEDTSETFAGDVSSAMDYLKSRTEIDPTKIGLLGHSEGGVIAPMVAVNRSDVAFLVLLAGSGVPGKEVILQQNEAVLKASGADAATLEHKMALEKRVLDAVLTGQSDEQLRADLIAEFKDAAQQMPEDQRKQLGDLDQWAAQNVDMQFNLMQGAWMTFFLTHNPAPVLEKVHAPVLALFGGKDVQVVAATNEPAVKAALEKAGNKGSTTKTIPDVNHLFQAAVTGSPSEYGTGKPEFAPGVVETIAEWVVEQTR